MQKLESGFYLIKDGKTTKLDGNSFFKNHRLTTPRYITKDFSFVDLEKFNNCILWCSHTPINLDIEIAEFCGIKPKNCLKRELKKIEIKPKSSRYKLSQY